MVDLLKDQDLFELTHMKRPADQCRWLDQWGIPFRKRPDGTPTLTWDAFNNKLLCAETTPSILGDDLEHLYPGEAYYSRPWDKTGQAPYDWLVLNMPSLCISPKQLVKDQKQWHDPACTNGGGIYFLINNAEIVYIGISNGIHNRILVHERNRLDFTHYSCITTVPKRHCQIVEAFYIHALNPKLNSRYDPLPLDVAEMADKAAAGEYKWPDD